VRPIRVDAADDRHVLLRHRPPGIAPRDRREQDAVIGLGPGRSRQPGPAGASVAAQAVDCSEMEGGAHSSAELTVSVKVPCQECGGRGYLETVGEGGHVVAETTKECLTCGGIGLIPEDMPLSQFRELLASDFG
jgi:hypothetical protein